MLLVYGCMVSRGPSIRVKLCWFRDHQQTPWSERLSKTWFIRQPAFSDQHGYGNIYSESGTRLEHRILISFPGVVRGLHLIWIQETWDGWWCIFFVRLPREMVIFSVQNISCRVLFFYNYFRDLWKVTQIANMKGRVVSPSFVPYMRNASWFLRSLFASPANCARIRHERAFHEGFGTALPHLRGTLQKSDWIGFSFSWLMTLRTLVSTRNPCKFVI